MDAILQNTFSSAFSWMKMFELWLKFHWDNGLAPTRRQAIIWPNDGQFTDAYASLGFNELQLDQIGCHFANNIFKYIFLN